MTKENNIEREKSLEFYKAGLKHWYVSRMAVDISVLTVSVIGLFLLILTGNNTLSELISGIALGGAILSVIVIFHAQTEYVEKITTYDSGVKTGCSLLKILYLIETVFFGIGLTMLILTALHSNLV